MIGKGMHTHNYTRDAPLPYTKWNYRGIERNKEKYTQASHTRVHIYVRICSIILYPLQFRC